ncbi:MAG: cytochrome P450 [Anaerolineae bacterium]|nr:cytochrome P450 [Anaerolineae bacterium]
MHEETFDFRNVMSSNDFSENYRLDPLSTLLSMGLDKDHTWFRIGRRYGLLINAPTLLQAVMTDRSFIRGKVSRNLKHLFGAGLGALDGELHRQHRNVLRPAFAGSIVENLYAPTIAEETTNFAEHMKGNETFDIFSTISSFLVYLTAKNLFGADWHDHAESIALCLRTGSRYLVGQSAHPGESFSQNASGYFHPPLEQVLNEIINHYDGTEDLRRAISFIFKEGMAQSAWTLDTAKDEMRFLLVAGVETTAATASFALDLLARNSRIQDEVYNEVTPLFSQGRPISQDDLRSLRWLTWVIKETLRLFPPIWVFTREASRDVVIQELVIPKGSLVLLSAYLTQRDGRYFTNPLDFVPERFSERISPWKYFPFGGGHRHCLGEGYGVTTLSYILINMLRYWKLAVTDNAPLDIEPASTLTPRGKHLLTLERR